MSVYDREYMREGKGGEIQSSRRPRLTSKTNDSDSNRLTRAEQVGMVIAALAVIGLLLGVAIF